MIELPITITVLDIVSLIVIASFLYHFLSLYEVEMFVRRRRQTPAPTAYRPPVTLLKPLAGWDDQVHQNVQSFCQQHYPPYQMILGTADLDQQRVAAARLAAECRAAVRWEVCHPPLAVNPKISELLHMDRLAEHEVLVLSDADIRVGPDYLARVVAPLQDPLIGLVTCLYTSRQAATTPAAVEALMINVDFIPSVLVANRLFGSRFVMGATVAIRREVLEAAGGFAALADYLADDHQLGVRVRQAGYQIVISDYIVENCLPTMRLGDLFRHQVRWSRTIRVNQPAGWFFSVITHLMVCSTMWLLLTNFSPSGWHLVGLALVFRLLEGGYMNARLNGLPDYWRVAWLMPFKDAFSFLMWVLSFTDSRVHWAGRDYLVARDGRMAALEPPGGKVAFHN